MLLKIFPDINLDYFLLFTFKKLQLAVCHFAEKSQNTHLTQQIEITVCRELQVFQTL